jgi:hypothetical protein
MVDEVVVGQGHEPGLDFKDHFLAIRPQLLVVTEDDKYADIKKQLCAQVRGRGTITPTSTCQPHKQPGCTQDRRPQAAARQR